MNTIHIRPYTTNDYTWVRRNMEEGGLYYPEIDAEQKLNEKITRNPGSILVAELNGAVVGNILIMEDLMGTILFQTGSCQRLPR